MLEVRPVPVGDPDPRMERPIQAIWCKPRLPVDGDLALHQAVIGFASDVGLVRAGLQQHPNVGGRKYQSASLDHALWFHREASANDWMLYVLDSPVAADGRGLSRGSIYTREGILVASVG